MSVEIQELDGRRLVRVTGEQMDRGDLRDHAVSIETTLSAETVRALAKDGQMWLIYTIRRIEDPDDTANRISALIEEFPPSADKPRFLDFGCGYGASTFPIARSGYAVVGVDVDPKLHELGRLVSKDIGIDHLASFVDVEETSELPFADGEFDAVFAYSVFEHIPAAKRPAYARECWRVLKPGGVLYLAGCPNRLWPYDGHTTFMPLVHWLPLWLAVPLIHRFCRTSERNCSREQLILDGLIGINLFSFLKYLPGARVSVKDGGNVGFHFSTFFNRKGGNPLKRAAKSAVRGWYRMIENPLRRMGLPVEGFLPYVNVAINKVGSS